MTIRAKAGDFNGKQTADSEVEKSGTNVLPMQSTD
jgi:hypothetical protein